MLMTDLGIVGYKITKFTPELVFTLAVLGGESVSVDTPLVSRGSLLQFLL